MKQILTQAKYKVELNFDELSLLDGAVSLDVQKVIDQAKREFSFGFTFPFMSRVLRESEEKGKLSWTFDKIRSCSLCDKKYTWQPYKRDTKYKRKGDLNIDKPLYYRGVDFNRGFIHFIGTGDICEDCFKEHDILKRLVDYILDHDLKVEIQKNNYRATKYIKDNILICFNCGKEMQESKMGKHRTLFGDGSYPSECPHCFAESLPFGKTHKSTNKFVMIEGSK